MRRVPQAEAEALPFIGARAPDGSLPGEVDYWLEKALDPVYFDDSDGWRFYFEAGRYD